MGKTQKPFSLTSSSTHRKENISPVKRVVDSLRYIGGGRGNTKGVIGSFREGFFKKYRQYEYEKIQHEWQDSKSGQRFFPETYKPPPNCVVTGTEFDPEHNLVNLLVKNRHDKHPFTVQFSKYVSDNKEVRSNSIKVAPGKYASLYINRFDNNPNMDGTLRAMPSILIDESGTLYSFDSLDEVVHNVKLYHINAASSSSVHAKDEKVGQKSLFKTIAKSLILLSVQIPLVIVALPMSPIHAFSLLGKQKLQNLGEKIKEIREKANQEGRDSLTTKEKIISSAPIRALRKISEKTTQGILCVTETFNFTRNMIESFVNLLLNYIFFEKKIAKQVSRQAIPKIVKEYTHTMGTHLSNEAKIEKENSEENVETSVENNLDPQNSTVQEVHEELDQETAQILQNITSTSNSKEEPNTDESILQTAKKTGENLSGLAKNDEKITGHEVIANGVKEVQLQNMIN